MTDMKLKVATEYISKNQTNREIDRKKEIPCVVSTLTKDLYLPSLHKNYSIITYDKRLTKKANDSFGEFDNNSLLQKIDEKLKKLNEQLETLNDNVTSVLDKLQNGELLANYQPKYLLPQKLVDVDKEKNFAFKQINKPNSRYDANKTYISTAEIYINDDGIEPNEVYACYITKIVKYIDNDVKLEQETEFRKADLDCANNCIKSDSVVDSEEDFIHKCEELNDERIFEYWDDESVGTFDDIINEPSDTPIPKIEKGFQESGAKSWNSTWDSDELDISDVSNYPDVTFGYVNFKERMKRASAIPAILVTEPSDEEDFTFTFSSEEEEERDHYLTYDSYIPDEHIDTDTSSDDEEEKLEYLHYETNDPIFKYKQDNNFDSFTNEKFIPEHTELISEPKGHGSVISDFSKIRNNLPSHLPISHYVNKMCDSKHYQLVSIDEEEENM